MAAAVVALPVALAATDVAPDAAARRAAVERMTKSIIEPVETWSLRPMVKALQALRGISVISATVLTAELGDLARFESAPKLMGYIGLVPSEHSSGQGRRQGRITRAGNGHARRILVEAAWAYRFRARQSRDITLRSAAVSPEVRRIAWRAQERLCAKYRRLTARGKNKTTAAIARELAGFVWAIARDPSVARSGSREADTLPASPAQAPSTPRHMRPQTFVLTDVTTRPMLLAARWRACGSG